MDKAAIVASMTAEAKIPQTFQAKTLIKIKIFGAPIKAAEVQRKLVRQIIKFSRYVPANTTRNSAVTWGNMLNVLNVAKSDILWLPANPIRIVVPPSLP